MGELERHKIETYLDGTYDDYEGILGHDEEVVPKYDQDADESSLKTS